MPSVKPLSLSGQGLTKPAISLSIEGAAQRLARAAAPFVNPLGILILLAPFLAAVVVCLAASWRWPLIHDAPLMDYIAGRILSGAVPYRDIFDMNLPGTYVIHIVALRVFGRGDLGWRIFDLLWLSLTACALYAFCRPISRWGGLLAGAVFLAYHLGQGAESLGQRDFLLCLFLLLGAHLIARSVEVGHSRLTFAAGLLVGFASTVKPHAAIYGVFMLAVLMGYRGRRGPRGCIRHGALFLAGAAVAPAAIAVWLASVGGLRPLITMVSGYLMPYYPKLGQVSAATLAGRLIERNGFWILLVAAVPWNGGRRSPRYMLAILGAFYGILHFALQERGWWYHEYPFQLFFFTMVAMSIAALLSRPEPKRRMLGWLCLLLALYPLATACYRVARAPMSGGEAPGKKRVLDSLVAYLRPRVDPARDTVQTMDTAAGGVDSLFVLHVREATRFMYDFHLLYFANEPFVRRLRSQFMSEIRAARPKYVVLFRWSWPPPSGYQRFDTFPEFRQWLDQFYELDYEQPDYRVFRRKANPS